MLGIPPAVRLAAMAERRASATTRRTTALTRSEIVDEALALIDERGLEALSMRALGTRLGVEAMAIYRHVADKRTLLDAIAERLLAELALTPVPARDWRTLLTSFAHGYRRMAEAHPHAVPLLSGRPSRAYLARRDDTEAMLRDLVSAGFTPAEATMALRLVGRYVVGFALDTRRSEPPPDDGTAADLVATGHPLLAGLIEQLIPSPVHEWELFTFGLSVLLDGLERRLPAR